MSTQLSDRLIRIITNLRAETAFNGKLSEPQTLATRMAKLHTPAVSLAIIDNFEIVEACAFGVNRNGDVSTLSENTLFQAGSISKPVFATAIMHLVQQCKLDLDEDINTYLKSWKIPANQGWQPHVTLRQILSHTAGLTVHGFQGYKTTETIPTLPDILDGKAGANSAPVEVNIIPGLQHRYSGGGTTVAQLAVTDYLNEAFPTIMQRLVLEPLHMHNSTFENPLPTHLLPKAAIAHPWRGDPLIGDHSVYPEMAAAGLWSTPTDLATFGLALQKGLRGDDTGFLTKQSVETLLSPVLQADKDSNNGYCALGFFCSGKETNTFGHGGWDEGFVAEASFHKTLGKGAVIMLNSNEGVCLLEEILNAVKEEFDWPKGETIEDTLILTNLDTYSGQYESALGHRFNINASSNGLQLQYDQQPPIDFKATSTTHFVADELNTELDFEQEKNTVLAVAISQNGVQIKAHKKTHG